MQPGQQRPSVPHVAPHRGIGPLRLAVAVEPQVQRDKLADVRDHGRGEPQCAEAVTGQGGPGQVMVVEGHPAIGQHAARLGLADVVQQRREPDHQVVFQAIRRLQRGRPGQHGQGVLVDVLVPDMLVRLQPQPGDLRQDLLRHPGADEH